MAAFRLPSPLDTDLHPAICTRWALPLLEAKDIITSCKAAILTRSGRRTMRRNIRRRAPAVPDSSNVRCRGTTTSRQSGIAAAMVLRSAGAIQPSRSPQSTRCGCRDFRHPPLELSALPFAGQVDRRADPDAFRNAEGLLQDSLEQRLYLLQAPRGSGESYWARGSLAQTAKTPRSPSSTRVNSRLAIIARKRPIWSALKDIPSGVTGSSAKTRPNRCGCISSIRAAMMPPVEWVARWQNRMFSASSAASMSSACCCIE